MATPPSPDQEKTLSSNDTDVVAVSPPPPAETRIAPGAVIAGRYRISGILGAGGMGEVFRADDLRLGQQVAMKFVPAKFARSAVLLGRLQEEVRLGRLVTHPNVCRIYDIGEGDGASFVTMEYIEGEDLSRLLKRIGRFAQDKAVDIARGVAAGLLAAHAKGVLHRDLKPANVMFDSLGSARIMDFGLALDAREQQAGVLAGTPAYVAPEQLEGTPASVQSDLYALGLVMYEILTGKRVHNVKSFDDRIRDPVNDIARPSSLVRDVDPAVEAIILRCLSNDPARRPRSAREVIEALPGGDPLQAAMAAGETPSPRVVAAASTEGSLKPVAAASLLALVVLEMAFAFYAARAYSIFGMLQPKSPEFLGVRADEIRASVGLPQQPYESADWTRNMQQIAWMRESLSKLTKGPAAMSYWVRRESHPLMRGGSELAPMIDDPPQVAPGASTITVDPRGRLTSLSAVPQSSWNARAPDWRALFAAAGLDLTRFAPAEPRTLPPAYADARAAWSGTHPDDGTPIRVEAAAWRGTPVFFRIAAPWDDAPDRTNVLPFAGSAGTAYKFAMSFLLLFFAAAGVLLAWRNLRMKRGDRKGALRMAAVLFVLQMIGIVGFADHALSVSHEADIILEAAASALLWTAGYFLVYLALEPFVRRRWPDRLISWARLIAGDWRDPMVGRDVLIGIAAGLGHVAVALIPSFLGIMPVTASTSLIRNAFTPFAGIAKQMHYGIVQGLTLMIALMILTILLRRRLLAAMALFVLVFFVFQFGSGDPRMLLVFGVGAALIAFITARVGLLASIVYCATFFLIFNYLLPTEMSWYTLRALIAPLFLAALAAWAFRTSLGRQRMFDHALLEA